MYLLFDLVMAILEVIFLPITFLRDAFSHFFLQPREEPGVIIKDVVKFVGVTALWVWLINLWLSVFINPDFHLLLIWLMIIGAVLWLCGMRWQWSRRISLRFFGYRQILGFNDSTGKLEEIYRSDWRKREIAGTNQGSALLLLGGGLLTRPSRMVGPGSRCWKFLQVIRDDANELRVVLADKKGLHFSWALRLLQDGSCNANLENRLQRAQQLAEKEAAYHQMVAAVSALSQALKTDKRFRAPIVKEINEYLRGIIQETHLQVTDTKTFELWEGRIRDKKWVRPSP